MEPGKPPRNPTARSTSSDLGGSPLSNEALPPRPVRTTSAGDQGNGAPGPSDAPPSQQPGARVFLRSATHQLQRSSLNDSMRRAAQGGAAERTLSSSAIDGGHSVKSSLDESAADFVLQRKARSEAPRIQSRLFSFAKQYRHASGFATPVEEGDETAVEFSRGATPFESGSLSEPLVPGGQRRGSHFGTPKPLTHRLTTVLESTAKLHEGEAFARRLQCAGITFQVIFTLVCSAAALVVWKVDGRDGRFSLKFHVPLFSWLLVAAVICPLLALCKFAVDLFMMLLEMASLTLFENVHYVLMGLSRSLRMLVAALTFQMVAIYLIEKSTATSPHGVLRSLEHFIMCVCIFSLIELVKTLSCRILSLRVHSEALFDSLQDTFEKEAILDKLMKKVQPGVWEAGTQRAKQLATERHIPESSVEIYLKDLYQLTLQVKNKAPSFTEQMSRLVKQFQSMSETQLDEHAAHAAEYFWWTVRQNLSDGKLFRDDLDGILTQQDDADYAFSLFDLDGDGFVVEPEVHSRFQKIYRERRDMAITLENTEVVLATLEALVGGIMHVVGAFCYLAIFGVDVGHLVLSLSSMTLALAFIFGNSLRTIYESVVFLFVVRPYKVGDAIWYEKSLHRVSSFGLLWTELYRYDGNRLSVPNEKLMATDIVNITESKAMQDRIQFEVDATDVTPDLVRDLSDSVAEVVALEHLAHLYDAEFTPYAAMVQVTDPLKYQIMVVYQLAFNGEKHARVCEARMYVTHCIGQWQQRWQLTNSCPRVPLEVVKGRRPSEPQIVGEGAAVASAVSALLDA